MNIYKLLKMAAGEKTPGFVKLLGLWTMHSCRRRYIGVFLDPVLACNLRCRMCFFSDDTMRAGMTGTISEERLALIEHAFFHRALKLQIGCGAEPTLYPRLAEIIARGKNAGVPYISLITNGQLIASGKVSLPDLVKAGLNEITLSMHGTRQETYEHLMTGAKFSNLLTLLNIIQGIKKEHPKFRVRVNFTVNSLNVHDLEGSGFWDIWPEGLQPDIVQLRPVQKLGESAWTDFEPRSLKEHYDTSIGSVAAECRHKGITCIAPSKHQIDEVATPQDGVSAMIEDITYCYVSPRECYKPDFNPATDTFEIYHRRHRTAHRLFRAAFSRKLRDRGRHISKKLNYTVK